MLVDPEATSKRGADGTDRDSSDSSFVDSSLGSIDSVLELAIESFGNNALVEFNSSS